MTVGQSSTVPIGGSRSTTFGGGVHVLAGERRRPDCSAGGASEAEPASAHGSSDVTRNTARDVSCPQGRSILILKGTPVDRIRGNLRILPAKRCRPLDR